MAKITVPRIGGENQEFSIMSAPELVAHFAALQTKKADNPALHKPKTTGIPPLDEHIGGIALGQYIIIGGPPKGGKTSLMVSLAGTMGKNKVKFLYISLEMGNMQIAAMMHANVGNIDRDRFRDVTLAADDWENLANAGEEIASYQGYFHSGAWEMSDIIKVLEAIENDIIQPEVVFIDYLQLIERGEYRTGNRAIELASISRRLKQLTLREKHPIAVVVGSQLSNEAIRSRDYTGTSYLGSGAIFRDMDWGIIITPSYDETGEEIPTERNIVITGAREGKTGTLPMYFKGEHARFAPVHKEQTDMQEALSSITS